MYVKNSSGNATGMESGPLKSESLTGAQVRTLLLCCLVAVLDGNDTQLMGIGAPSIASALHVPPSVMGWAISGSWLGAAGGALVFGRAADRFGRKPVLLAAVLLFSLFTLLTPLANTMTALTAYRVLAGIGLGGATPCFIALAAAAAPVRLRGTVTSVVWAAFPLGLLMGALGNGWLLANYEWHNMFYCGGIASLLVAGGVAISLREPAAGLASREATGGSGLAELTASGRMRATLCIWAILFTTFGTTASMSWVPTILQQHGVSRAAAAIASSSLGFGALLGMVVAGRVVDRFGAARGLVVPMLLGAVATAAVGVWPGSPTITAAFVGLVGLLVGLGASGGIALTALVYPANIRSTGAGWGMGLGRLGQFAMPGAFALLLAQQWEAATIFLILAALPMLGAIAALFVQRSRAPAWTARALSPTGDPR